MVTYGSNPIAGCSCMLVLVVLAGTLAAIDELRKYRDNKRKHTNE